MYQIYFKTARYQWGNIKAISPHTLRLDLTIYSVTAVVFSRVTLHGREKNIPSPTVTTNMIYLILAMDKLLQPESVVAYYN